MGQGPGTLQDSKEGSTTCCPGTLRMGQRRKNCMSVFSPGLTERSGPENEVKGNEDVIHSVTGMAACLMN